MPYTYLTLNQALSELADRLYDAHPTASPFWSDAEKTLYINEALRVWNAMTSYWRDSFTFNLTQGVTWYDIPTAAGSLRPMTVTDTDLLTEIQYHFLEPALGKNAGVWTGSLQFNLTDIVQSIARRRDEVLSMSGCTITEGLLAAVAGPITLNDKTIDIRRVAWVPTVPSPSVGRVATPLFPDDQWALQAYERDFTSAAPGIPFTYRQSSEPPLIFQTDIDPVIAGNYDVLSIEAGAALDNTTNVVMVVPNDWAWVIKYGAMADLLGRDSVSKDSLRQKYCQMRYQQGLSMLFNASAVLVARMNAAQMDIESVQTADQYRPGWQAEAQNTPDLLLLAGLNTFAVAPVPSAAAKALTLIVVQNAPLPAGGGSNIQMGRDEYDVVLDYAQHLASLKMGGAEFLSTFPLLSRFYRQCQLSGSKLAQLGEFQKAIYELSQLQAMFNPVFSDASPEDKEQQ